MTRLTCVWTPTLCGLPWRHTSPSERTPAAMARDTAVRRAVVRLGGSMTPMPKSMMVRRPVAASYSMLSLCRSACAMPASHSDTVALSIRKNMSAVSRVRRKCRSTVTPCASPITVMYAHLREVLSRTRPPQ